VKREVQADAQVIVFIWVYASICVESLVRGLLQTLLSGASKVWAGSCPEVGLGDSKPVSGP